jgi:LPXTG-motif cell wall-anchored protein
MRKTRLAATAAITLGLALSAVALALPSQATTTAAPSFESCANLKGWYANPDEQAFLPEPTAAGLKFEGKDLIHHGLATPIDFADMDKVAYSFDDTTAGKVVFKVETSAPYSTIVTNADGKIWSTAMTYDQVGGQGNPVAKYTDLLGVPVKPGKVPFTGASRVATFGVGYWVEEGSTVVSSITFHGTTYPLTCPPPASPSASASTSASASASAKPSASASTSPSVRPSPSRSAIPSASPSTPPVLTPPTDDEQTPVAGNLPLTGDSPGRMFLLAAVALGSIAVGAGLWILARRRRTS